MTVMSSNMELYQQVLLLKLLNYQELHLVNIFEIFFKYPIDYLINYYLILL